MKKYRISRNNMAYGQMGMQQPSQEEMMMMQQQQAQQQPAPAQQDPQKQVMKLAQQVSAEIQKGKPTDVLTQELLEGGVPPQAIGQAFQMLVQQGVVDESEMQMVVQVLQSSQGEQQQAQPSEEEMMAMQQQQAAAQEPPMARAGYIRQQMKARAGMSVDQEAAFGSATNLIADKNMEKNALLKFTQDNVAANQFGQQYDQMYAGGNLEQARYGRGKARRQARRDARTADQGTNFAKNNSRRSRQLARRAVNEMPDIYSRADRRALREGLESGEFDKYDVYRGVDVFNPQPQSKPGYPEVDAGSWNSTMIPGRNWGAQTSVEEVVSPGEMVEETSTESNVITDFDNAYDYKNENGIIYTRKKGSSDWTKVDSESNAGRAIRKRVYGEDDVIFDEGPDYIDADATGETIIPIERDDTQGNWGDKIVDDILEKSALRKDKECEEWPGEGSGQTFVEWASNLPYDENGLYTTNCGETYNRTNLPGYNRENINARVPGGSAAYPMEFGGQYSSDGLEVARFGRGRARRQARRAERQGRRALGQADRSMRRAFGDIAFPAGVSPMMAGMPMMGTEGAAYPRMHFEGERGLFGRLKNFKMDIEGMGMPMNFSRGMFMNGIFNPYGMQGYNDTRYKITYPGQSTEITDTEKQVEGAKENQKLEDDTKQKGQQEQEAAEEEEAKETAETKEETGDDGIPKTCGENASVNEAGQCECNEGYVRNPNVKTFSCISEAELAARKDDEDPEGTNWVYIALGVGTIGGGIWALRKLAPKVRALISKNPAASKTARQALLKQIVSQFPNGTQMASGTKLLGEGVPISQTSITGTQMTEAELRASREAAERAAGETAEQAEKRIIRESLEGTSPKLLTNTSRRALPSARALSATEKAVLRGQIQNIPGMSNKAVKALASKYGLSTAGKKGDIARRLIKFAKLFQVGGSVNEMDENYGNPSLYRFTGGGPRFTDYFSDGGYYEDGGFPQYEDVYDPYMPMAENGMTIVDRPYQTAAEYGNEYAAYPGPYAEPIITDQIRESVINSGRLMDGVTGEEIERSTIMSPQDIYKTFMDKSDPDAGRKANELYHQFKNNPGPNAQYGGYKEGDVVDMTEAQLGAFLAGGGQVEFVD